MRSLPFMRKMYFSIVTQNLDYCLQLWSSGEGPALDRLEKVQSNFSKLIPSIRPLDYGERLKERKITSLQ